MEHGEKIMNNITKTKKYQSGQAIILIVFAIIGLIGMTALTVDGSNAYSDRRHAQNAADTAVLAAARAKIRGEDWKGAALQLANANSYVDTDHTENSSSPHVNVEVYQCSEVECNITPKPGDTLQDYIQVKITSTIKTYFGGVIGVWQVTNKVNSIARVKDGTKEPIGNGNALFAVNDKACKAVEYQGAANVNLVGAGIYSNSKCKDGAFFNNAGGGGTLTTPCLQTVGGMTLASVDVPTDCKNTGVEALPLPVLPQITCDGPATWSGNVMSPGSYTGAFPPNNVKYLQSGVYCVDGNFRLTGNTSLTGHNVVIYMINGEVHWGSQVTVRLDAPDDGEYKGLLLYLPPSNPSDVSINGGGDSEIVGTILAPKSECSVLGGGGQSGLQTQLVCDTIKLSGSSSTTIVYNPDLLYTPPIPPQMELNK
jgi:hypothetical protein